MKLATVSAGRRTRPAIVEGEHVRLLHDADMIALIRRLSEARDQNEIGAGERVPVGEVKLLAPVPRPPRNVFCVGKNYHAHAHEFATSGFDGSATEIVPEAPVIFTKPPSAVIGPGERGITRAEALEHVFGYTIINDVTARTLQHKHRQWVIGKGIDGFCPMGPVIVTADEVPDPGALRLRTFVNGEKRQDASVSDLIFDIPTLIETLSAGITLEAGDLIATGTPVGVGLGFKPPRFLKPGDVVRIEVDKIGALENPVA
jgi:2-keto-4-pentenoate hydratase/2-oxohepta-3-ene-1,7-dioic acid hydratase in catechol pathway